MKFSESASVKKVTVITGGAGGMGLATAKVLGQEHHVVLSDVSQQRLDTAIATLTQLGISCSAMVCDVTDRRSVDTLLQHARTHGKLVSVIHTAGISPQMAEPAAIMKVNALGTINITNACLASAEAGFALVNIASMAAHFMPAWLVPKRAYRHAFGNTDVFLRKALVPCHFMPTTLYRRGFAYSISKNFVMWYSKKQAAKFGEKGARIVSVSPGTFDTEMGRLEEKSGAAAILKDAALKRFGRPEEIADLIAFCASDKASYLTGVDVLCDGGVIASKIK